MGALVCVCLSFISCPPLGFRAREWVVLSVARAPGRAVFSVMRGPRAEVSVCYAVGSTAVGGLADGAELIGGADEASRCSRGRTSTERRPAMTSE